MYVFFTRRGDRVRVLYFDRDGYVLVTKRLEKGTFVVPWENASGRIAIEAAELLLVLEGIDLKGARRRERWAPRAHVARSSSTTTAVATSTS